MWPGGLAGRRRHFRGGAGLAGLPVLQLAGGSPRRGNRLLRAPAPGHDRGRRSERPVRTALDDGGGRRRPGHCGGGAGRDFFERSGELIAIVVLVAFNGVTGALFGPAESALLPEIVSPDDLGRANSLRTIVSPIAQAVVGPALGGAIIANFGTSAAFWTAGHSSWASRRWQRARSRSSSCLRPSRPRPVGRRRGIDRRRLVLSQTIPHCARCAHQIT
jgi:MFS family permease